MKKDQVVILEKRGVILVSGEDAKDFLQNIITNDINKVSYKNSVFAALLTPQGKYLNEFFIIQSNKGYLLDCSENSTGELIKDLSKYKLRSNVEIKDLSTKFVVGVINVLKFQELQKELKVISSPIFNLSIDDMGNNLFLSLFFNFILAVFSCPTKHPFLKSMA